MLILEILLPVAKFTKLRCVNFNDTKITMRNAGSIYN